MAKLGTMPQILCWNCRKLTPFELERCEHCGSAFAGSTGGVYRSGPIPTPRMAPRTTSSPKGAGARPKRTLAQIFEDLRRVRDASATTRGRMREADASVRLYQCPSCGRYVSEHAVECACGVRFAPVSAPTYMCPECGSRVSSDVNACPVCRAQFETLTGPGYVYVCPRCGIHVASDAVRCSCGVWFES